MSQFERYNAADKIPTQPVSRESQELAAGAILRAAHRQQATEEETIRVLHALGLNNLERQAS